MKMLHKSTLLILLIITAIVLFGFQFMTINDYKQFKPISSLNHTSQLQQITLHHQAVIKQTNSAPDIYIPPQRLIHLDLKGAPPLLPFFAKLFPLLRSLGATGILLEYEDMFPYSGPLANITAKNAYTPTQIGEILRLAAHNHLQVIPLIQTFGHLEFALKTPDFAHLREVPTSPQSICPSKHASLAFLAEMAAQIITSHPHAQYLHVGCDEVYQIGECELCRPATTESLFTSHIIQLHRTIARIKPTLKLIIWDDMLRKLPASQLVQLGELVEPMIWVYAEDVDHFVDNSVWVKYSRVFGAVWTASAFKGAFGETLTLPNAKRHLENNLKWLEIMQTRDKSFRKGFRGIALTGWSRYDHFAVLCELLPAGVPSLALSLTAVSAGYFNNSLKQPLMSALSCPGAALDHSSADPFIWLSVDPSLSFKLARCLFPGHRIFVLIGGEFQTMENEVRDFLEVVRRERGWMTGYNVRRNYSLGLRVDEVMRDFPRFYYNGGGFVRSVVDAMREVYDLWTIGEWIEQKVYPILVELERVKEESVALKRVREWQVRPLKVLEDLERFGMPKPDH